MKAGAGFRRAWRPGVLAAWVVTALCAAQNEGPEAPRLGAAAEAESGTMGNWPEARAALRFDFGTAASPVQNGYTKVSKNTAYSPKTGYGWGAALGREQVGSHSGVAEWGGAAGSTGVLDRDRGFGSGRNPGHSDLERDFVGSIVVYLKDCDGVADTFIADIPNGAYRVYCLFGDGQYGSGPFDLCFQGKVMDRAIRFQGSFSYREYPVIVETEKLIVTFVTRNSWAINAMLVVPTELKK